MVTAHELREIAYNYKLYELLDKLKAIAKTGETEYTVDDLDYDKEKQLERLGFTVDYHEYDDYARRITW